MEGIKWRAGQKARDKVVSFTRTVDQADKIGFFVPDRLDAKRQTVSIRQADRVTEPQRGKPADSRRVNRSHHRAEDEGQDKPRHPSLVLHERDQHLPRFEFSRAGMRCRLFRFLYRRGRGW